MFLLKKNASKAQIFRVLTDLEDQFPQHDFVAGDARFPEYEENVLATLELGNSKTADPVDIAEVSAFFRLKVAEIDGWKPS